MKLLKCSPISLLVLLLAATGPGRADVMEPTDDLPPRDGVYRDPAAIHADFDDGTVRLLLRRPEHRKFSDSEPPPQVIGDTTTHNFTSFGTVEFSLDDGVTWTPTAVAPTVSVDVTFVDQAGPYRLFTTEMTRFDADVFPGVSIRQSPTRPSLGTTVIQSLGPEDGIDPPD